MKLKNTLVIEVAGHTDNIGSDESNKKLSKARADAVKQYLIGKGIAATRISTQGYGADRPVALNDSDSNRQLNRRTEVRIIKE